MSRIARLAVVGDALSVPSRLVSTFLSPSVTTPIASKNTVSSKERYPVDRPHPSNTSVSNYICIACDRTIWDRVNPTSKMKRGIRLDSDGDVEMTVPRPLFEFMQAPRLLNGNQSSVTVWDKE
ncbi:hypothetical protein PsorP6_001455 [Peronosclerospora sorghi]|uniref:Uncharacterized protein n=1 Tax=Peronosclerospora sorghi TaxID=230839 RepID=A0ACC0WUE6_9STRA|nr:hypothetical protein PsorP6_001455 [Peronosclerospora sorghi]